MKFETGAKITGFKNVQGKKVNFVGKIASSRPHSMNWGDTVVHISLDAPTAFFGSSDIRTSICLRVDTNGVSEDRGVLHAKVETA